MLFMSIGARVKMLRKSLGMTQNELAIKVALKQPSLSYIENNPSSEIKQATLLSLSRALRTNPQWLSTGKGSPAQTEVTSPDESEAVTIYNLLNEVNRNAWMTTGRSLLKSQDDVPSVADPFAKSEKAKQ